VSAESATVVLPLRAPMARWRSIASNSTSKCSQSTTHSWHVCR